MNEICQGYPLAPFLGLHYSTSLPRTMEQTPGSRTHTAAKNSGRLDPGSANYPQLIANCISKPPSLFFRGNVTLLLCPNILAVVGSRILTPSNQASLNHVLRPIHTRDLTIVSGLARGMDSVAHRIALDNGMPTIAVLGSSVEPNEIYPRSNAHLAERIVERQGLLLSPFPPGTPIMNHNFPARNQVIAALARAVLITSAAKKSGALITARFALDYGKDVFVIPGPVTDALFEGTNALLQHGATPVVAPDDILSYFSLSSIREPQHCAATPGEQTILDILKQRSLSLNELVRISRLPVTTVSSIISAFELRGWVTILPDGQIQLT